MQILLYVWMNALVVSAASQSDLKDQMIADFGNCTYALDGQGDPAAELKVFPQKDCSGKPIRFCSMSVQCSGGEMFPAEIAATARLQVSCLVQEGCPADPIDCMAVEKEGASGGRSAILGVRPGHRPRSEDHRSETAQ